MTCDDWRSLVSLAADDRLEPGRLAELASHLSSCPACAEFSTLVARNKRALRGLPTSDPGESFTRSVVEAASRPRSPRRLLVIVGLAAGVALALVGWFLAQPKPKGTVDIAWRDRLWVLLIQVARDVRSTEAEDLASIRQELKDSGLASIAVPDETGFLKRLESISSAAEAKSLRADIEASGVLASWRPSVLLPLRPSIPGEAKEPFRRARTSLFNGRAEEAIAGFRAALESGDDPERADDALHWIAFLESRRDRIPEAIGAYLSLSASPSPWFDVPARKEAQRLAVEAAARHAGGPYKVALWSPSGELSQNARWMSVDYSPGSAWCSFELAGGNRGGKESPVTLEVQGVSCRASSPGEFRSKFPEAARFLQLKMPEVLSFLEEGVVEFQLAPPEPPPHGP